jgi:hypothetical protein
VANSKRAHLKPTGSEAPARICRMAVFLFSL